MEQNYWEKRWEEKQTGWDIGYPSPAIVQYIDKIENKNPRILIPGCGNAYEGSYLVEQGFPHVWLADFSPQPFENFKKKHPDFPSERLICGDFFDIKGSFDLILEQTFFCALHPKDRMRYAVKMAELLPSGSKLAGLLFKFPLTEQGPPFGGSESEYRSLFSTDFNIIQMEETTHSIGPRLGNELFFELQRK